MGYYTITCTKEVAEAVIARAPAAYARLVRVCDEGLTGQMNRSEEETIQGFVDQISRAAAKPAARADQPATARQISYLASLISRDEAAAMCVGASPDGVRVTDGLTKTRASQMIDQLLAGV